MWLRVLPLVALVLVAPLCGREDPVAALERQKQELLAGTVEKKDFWAQVERKGEAARKLRQLADRRSALDEELDDLEARRAGLEHGVAEARKVNRRAEQVKAELERRRAELDARAGELEATLARWRSAAAETGG